LSPLSTPLTHTKKTAPLAVAPHFRDSSTHRQQALSLQPSIHSSQWPTEAHTIAQTATVGVCIDAGSRAETEQIEDKGI
jgi:hypothetical protein